MSEKEEHIRLNDEQVRKMLRREVNTLAYRFLPRVLGALVDEKPRERDEILQLISKETGGGERFVFTVRCELENQGFVRETGIYVYNPKYSRQEIDRRYILTEEGVKEAWQFADEESQIRYDG